MIKKTTSKIQPQTIEKQEKQKKQKKQEKPLDTKDTDTKDTDTSPKKQQYFFGYVRVSSIQQADNYSLDSQREKLIAFGVPEKNIYSEVKSAKNIEERPNLQILLKSFNPESKTRQEDLKQLKEENLTKKTTLVVAYLDRISRNLNSGLSLIKELQDYGVGFISLDMPFNDNGSHSSVNNLMLTLLLWVAEFQLTNAKERQQIGIKKAIENGKYLGRVSRKLTPDILNTIESRIESGRSPLEIYKTLNISKSSYYKALKMIQEKKL